MFYIYGFPSPSPPTTNHPIWGERWKYFLIHKKQFAFNYIIYPEGNWCNFNMKRVKRGQVANLNSHYYSIIDFGWGKTNYIFKANFWIDLCRTVWFYMFHPLKYVTFFISLSRFFFTGWLIKTILFQLPLQLSSSSSISPNFWRSKLLALWEPRLLRMVALLSRLELSSGFWYEYTGLSKWFASIKKEF